MLSGAPTAAERARLEHRLVSFVPGETYSAGRYAELAHGEIDPPSQRADAQLVGGTGLYLQAALTDLELRPPPPPEVRARSRPNLRSAGSEALHAELATLGRAPPPRSLRRTTLA